MNFNLDLTGQLYPFLMVVGSAFIIGLEQAKMHGLDDGKSLLFGSHRTFTFIAILGYILFYFAPDYRLFIGGGLSLSAFLLVYYYFKIKRSNDHGLTSVILGLIVYCLAPIFILLPLWLSLSILVLILVLSEVKEQLNKLTEKIGRDEFITLSKFIVLSGIIIPVLPNAPLFPFMDITPKEVWIAVVVISGISYVSYLLKRYVFPESGTILTGILGGFYSSTATTIVLSKQSKQNGAMPNQYASAILFATTAMYVRLLILVFIFNAKLGMQLLPYLGTMVLVCSGVGYALYKNKKADTPVAKMEGTENSNPLQIKMALLFAVLFIGLSMITHFSLQKFGTSGMNVLAWVVGFADIDPFLLNLFQGKLDVTQKVLLLATLQAITSNNVLKAAYARSISSKETGRLVLGGFAVIFVVCLLEIVGVSIWM